MLVGCRHSIITASLVSRLLSPGLLLTKNHMLAPSAVAVNRYTNGTCGTGGLLWKFMARSLGGARQAAVRESRRVLRSEEIELAFAVFEKRRVVDDDKGVFTRKKGTKRRSMPFGASMGGRGTGSGVVNGRPRALFVVVLKREREVVVIHKFSGVDWYSRLLVGEREPVLWPNR